MAVPIQTTSSFSAGNPTQLFEGQYFTGVTGRVYDVSRDDRKVLMIREPQAAPDQSATPASMVVVLNWLEELRTRLAAR